MSDALAANSPVIPLRAKNRGSPHLPAKAGSSRAGYRRRH